MTSSDRAHLKRYAWLSIGAAVATISLKGLAYRLTGSVGLLSDALESLVNLAAALFALWILTIAARPPDEDHPFGHSKAEFFAGGMEGVLIAVAALSIAWTAVDRLLHPRPLEELGLGLLLCALASGVNFVVARILLRVGRQFNSLTLEADAAHLLTDVWTSGGVILGVGMVSVTGWAPLDPLVAIAVAANILWSGVGLTRRAVEGLMDTALPPHEVDQVKDVLKRFEAEGILSHALRTRHAGSRRFVSVHVLVPGQWTVQKGHDELERLEADIRSLLPETAVFTHLEPIEDPVSWDDGKVDR